MTRVRFVVLSLAVFSLLACRASSVAESGPAADIREPAVSGKFYPADPATLRLAVEKFLGDAGAPAAERPVALVAPHAGFVFSGPIAADAWRQAQGHPYDLLVILGTNHTVPPFRGAAIYPGRGFRTPLGVAEVDRAAVEALAAAGPEFALDAVPHAREHSVEAQIPFAQVLFPKARILPLVVGDGDPETCRRVGEALARALRGRNALIVASTDLSHYPSAHDAPSVDRPTLEAIARLDPAALRVAGEAARGIPGLSTCACGEAPVLVLLSTAKELGAARGTVVSYAHSGDTPLGDPHRVVGYGAVALFAGPGGADTRALLAPPEPVSTGSLVGSDRKALLGLARETIARFLSTGTVPLARGFSAQARRPRGAFVTLTKGGQLRGCIGRMTPGSSLDRTVAAMALQAAVGDSRFPPVVREELPQIAIEISVLTPMRPVTGPGEIVVGQDGVLLEKEGHQAVFLPQVAPEQGWGREEMLDHLCVKAGLPQRCWKQGARFKVFRAEVFREGDGA